MKHKAARKYLRQVKRLYSGKSKSKKQFIHELEDALLCFLEEHPQATYSDLTNEFGQPSEIKESLSFHTACELRKRNMILYWAVTILCSIAVAIVLFFTIKHILLMYDYSNGYYIEQYENNEKDTDNLNPITKATDPPLENHQTFD